MTEKVVSFLLVDENEEIQVSEPVGEVGVLWLSRGALVGRELLLEGSSRKEKSKKSSRFDGSGVRPGKLKLHGVRFRHLPVTYRSCVTSG